MTRTPWGTDDRVRPPGRPPLREQFRDALLDAVAVLLPVDCAGCGRADRALCATCERALSPVPTRRVLDAAGRHPLVVHAGLEYRGVARRSILALKGEGRTDVAVRLAPAVAAAVRAAGREFSGPVLGSATSVPHGDRRAQSDRIVLCPIPSSRAAYRRRGYAPVRMLLSRCGLRTAPLLRVARGTRSQKTLDRAARGRNARGAMVARRSLRTLRVLLVDDVVTSGATLLDAARAVREAGGDVLGAVVLASTPRVDGLGGNSR